MISDVAIQFVNYKTKKYLEKSLEDVLKDLAGSSISYVITVIDNDSGDDLSDFEEKYKSRGNIFFYYHDKNVGFGTGHNILAKKSQSKYILILNPDLEFIEEKTIERLVKKLESSPEIAAVGPKLVGKDGNVQVWDHGECRGAAAWISNNAGNSYWKDRNDECEVAWVSGAVFMIKRDIFEKVGGFDENFFLYKEEEDLCLRIRQIGKKIIYSPSIRVQHYNSVVASKSKYMLASKLYYIKKHYSNPVKQRILERLQKYLYPPN